MRHDHFATPRNRFALSLAAAGFLAACSDVAPVEPTRRPSDVAPDARRIRQEPLHPGEARFFRLAQIVPGFGGYFFDRGGNVHVYLTDLSRERQIRGILRSLLERPNVRQRPRRPPQVVVHQGTYDFPQLSGWRDALFHQGHRALHSIAVAEAENVVRIGVSTPNDAKRDTRPVVATRNSQHRAANRRDSTRDQSSNAQFCGASSGRRNSHHIVRDRTAVRNWLQHE